MDWLIDDLALDDYVTTSTAAWRLGVTPKTATRWFREDGIPAYRTRLDARLRLIRAVDVDRVYHCRRHYRRPVTN